MFIARSSLLLGVTYWRLRRHQWLASHPSTFLRAKEFGKTPVGDAPQVVLVDDGLENDAHGKVAPPGFVLAEASIAKARDMGLEVGPGDFAENFTTEGIDLLDLPLGTQLRLGKDVLVEISQIGKSVPYPLRHLPFGGRLHLSREGIFRRGAAWWRCFGG